MDSTFYQLQISSMVSTSYQLQFIRRVTNFYFQFPVIFLNNFPILSTIWLLIRSRLLRQRHSVIPLFRWRPKFFLLICLLILIVRIPNLQKSCIGILIVHYIRWFLWLFFKFFRNELFRLVILSKFTAIFLIVIVIIYTWRDQTRSKHALVVYYYYNVEYNLKLWLLLCFIDWVPSPIRHFRSVSNQIILYTCDTKHEIPFHLCYIICHATK